MTDEAVLAFGLLWQSSITIEYMIRRRCHEPSPSDVRELRISGNPSDRLLSTSTRDRHEAVVD